MLSDSRLYRPESPPSCTALLRSARVADSAPREWRIHPRFGASTVTRRAVLIIAFTLRALATGAQALIDVRLFRVGTFSTATGLLFLSGFALYGAMLLVPLYFQQVRGQ